MILFLLYLSKMAVCLTFFYLFYRILLVRDTFHTLNRCTLLAMMPLSFLLPSIQMEVQSPYGISQIVSQLEEVLIVPSGTQALQENIFSWSMAVFVVYLLGVAIFWGKHLYAMINLLHLIHRGEKKDDGQGNTLIIHQDQIAPFSWMHYIVISQKDLEESGAVILLHEQSHIRHHHSWDLILADVFISLQWFNPAAWLVKQELQNVHEYQADENVINQGIDAKTYQLLLIKKAVGTRLYSMANSFNHSTLKKRITMMIKRKSNPWARMKYLYVLPLAAMAVAAFARPEKSSVTNEISKVKVSNLSTTDKANESQTSIYAELAQNPQKIYDNKDIDEPAKYKDGEKALLGFIARNLKYPETAIDKKIEGNSVIRFVVNENGKISNYSIQESSHPILDEAALEVVKKIPPHWEPGKMNGQKVSVTFTLPIRFRIQ